MTATNALTQTTTYTYSANQLTEIQFPDSADHDIDITYSAGRVSGVDLGFGTWTYTYIEANGDLTTTVTNPDATTRVYVSTIATGRIDSVTNELGETLSYEYDGAARRTKVTLPEGNYTQYTYGTRGNIIELRQVSKTPGTPPDIVVTATYPTLCGNPRTCNKPTSTTDARGQTDYSYDSVHGGVLTVTAPAASGADRLQTRFTYSQYQARYESGGNWTNGTPVWRLTSTSVCAIASSCEGTASETVTSITYPDASTPNNVLPTSTTAAAGDGSISATTTMTYTDWGDVLAVDGPLPGAADTTRYYYDAARRLVGEVGPDPDGGGAYRAVRTTYNAAGQPAVAERGTVTNQSDSAFSTFSLLEKHDTVYDSFARPIQSRLWDGGSIVALTEFSYDDRGRAECTAVRMNPATFAGSPSDACTQATAGEFGPDRIRRKVYDAAGRVSEVQSAYGTALEQTIAAYTYTANGQVATQTDARGYLTRYEYDGLDRLWKRSYPDPNNTNQSSTADYEEFTYDVAGRLTNERRRSGESFGFSYDDLGRITFRDAPGSQPDVSYDYDLLGRVTSASQVSETITTSYDALSRVRSETSSVLGTVSYEYDEAGRRKRMDYPGGFYVTYAYDTVGALSGIFENGTTSLATFSYDNLGRRTSLTRGNGVTTSYAYDAASRLATLVQDAAGSSYDATFDFAYNPADQINSRTGTNAAYDAVLSAGFSENYTADGLNRYTTALGVTPSYDARGNLTGDGTKTYGYDYDNRLTSASGGVALAYDPFGRLHEIDGSAATRFLYDGDDVIAEYDGSGNVLRRYVHGPGLDEPLVWYEGSGTNDRRWFLADERGSVIGIANNAGVLTAVDRYDVFGVPDATNNGRFQYTGQMWIEELGLYHYKGRVYHAQLGRFLQTDPIGTAGGMNLYAYVANDPINGRDPSGFQEESLRNALLCNQSSAMCAPVPAGIDQFIVFGCDWFCQSSRYEQELALQYLHQSMLDAGAQVQQPRPPQLASAAGALGSGSERRQLPELWIPPPTREIVALNFRCLLLGSVKDCLLKVQLLPYGSSTSADASSGSCNVGRRMLIVGAGAGLAGTAGGIALYAANIVGFPEIEAAEVAAGGLLLAVTGGEPTLAALVGGASAGMDAFPVGVALGAASCAF